MVILSNKENWLVYPEEIAKRLNVSRDMIDRHLKKLEDAGYMRVVKKASVEVEESRLSDSSQISKLPIFNLRLCCRDWRMLYKSYPQYDIYISDFYKSVFYKSVFYK